MDGLPGLKVRNISEIVFEIIMINNNANNYAMKEFYHNMVFMVQTGWQRRKRRARTTGSHGMLFVMLKGQLCPSAIMLSHLCISTFIYIYIKYSYIIIFSASGFSWWEGHPGCFRHHRLQWEASRCFAGESYSSVGVSDTRFIQPLMSEFHIRIEAELFKTSK